MSSNDDVEGIRLNKVFKSTHSRREADKLISNGRVTINDEIVESMGQRVIPFQDVVKLDGVVIQGWEARG
jgi:16S rRNA U516 pseudouridylate synthase RsuA-like enzyme